MNEQLKEKFRGMYWSVYLWFYENTRWYYSIRARIRALRPVIKTAFEIEQAEMHGNVLAQFDREVATIQTKCNHRKGGTIRRTWEKGDDGVEKETTTGADIAKSLYGGTAQQYSVMKHQIMNGDMRIRCTRCGKTWTAPIRKEFATEREFWAAIEDYERAKKFETNNHTSTSLQFQWRYRDGSDGSEVPRKAMAARV